MKKNRRLTLKDHDQLASLIVRVTLAESVVSTLAATPGYHRAVATIYEYLWLKQSKRRLGRLLVKDTNLDAFKVTEIINLATAMKKSIEYIVKEDKKGAYK